MFQKCFVDDAVGGANEGFNCAALGRRILLMNMSSVHAAVWYMTLANIDRGSWFVAARTSHRQQSPVIQPFLIIYICSVIPLAIMIFPQASHSTPLLSLKSNPYGKMSSSKRWFTLPSQNKSSTATKTSKSSKAWKSTKKFLSSVGEPPTAEYDRQQAAKKPIKNSGKEAFGAINYGPYHQGGPFGGGRI